MFLNSTSWYNYILKLWRKGGKWYKWVQSLNFFLGIDNISISRIFTLTRVTAVIARRNSWRWLIMLPLGSDAKNGKELERKTILCFLKFKNKNISRIQKLDNIINIQVHLALSNSVLFYVCSRYFLNEKMLTLKKLKQVKYNWRTQCTSLIHCLWSIHKWKASLRLMFHSLECFVVPFIGINL